MEVKRERRVELVLKANEPPVKERKPVTLVKELYNGEFDPGSG